MIQKKKTKRHIIWNIGSSIDYRVKKITPLIENEVVMKVAGN